MRRFLRHRLTGKVFAGDRWVSDPKLAKEFKTLAEAIRTAVAYRLDYAQIVTQIGARPNPAVDFELNLTAILSAPRVEGQQNSPPDLSAH